MTLLIENESKKQTHTEIINREVSWNFHSSLCGLFWKLSFKSTVYCIYLLHQELNIFLRIRRFTNKLTLLQKNFNLSPFNKKAWYAHEPEIMAHVSEERAGVCSSDMASRGGVGGTARMYVCVCVWVKRETWDALKTFWVGVTMFFFFRSTFLIIQKLQVHWSIHVKFCYLLLRIIILIV